MDRPEWLPEPLNQEDYNDWESLEDAAYQIFCNDFIEKESLYFKKKTVKLNFEKEFREKKCREKSFYHLVKKTEDRRSRRNRNDSLRAVRIGWVRPLIENYNDKNVLYWDYWESEYSGIVRIYIWLKKYRFVVILQDEPTEYLLITAYFVDREDRLREKYSRRIN